MRILSTISYGLLLVTSGLPAARNAVADQAAAPRFLTGRQIAEASPVHPPERWSAAENVAWKTDLPGLGWSSPIVWEQRVFLTTCVNTGEDQAPRKGLYLEDLDANKYPPDKSEHQWKVYCLDLASGSIRWERISHQGVPAKPHHIKNTLASETPTTDGERLYVLFGNVGLFCYDLDGQLLWKHRLEPRETRYGWGNVDVARRPWRPGISGQRQ